MLLVTKNNKTEKNKIINISILHIRLEKKITKSFTVLWLEFIN